MWLRLIMVGPEGPVNLGYVARLAENFEVDELALVSPQASIAESLRWAARGSSRLLDVAVYPSLSEALKDVDLSICTSDESSARDILRTAVTPEEAAAEAARRGRVAVVLGRESVGLTREELSLCDLLCTIPASSRYTALNVSNAAAIVLYELYKAARSQRRLAEPPSKDVVRLTEAYARALYEHLSRGPSEEVGLAFRKLVSRASSAEASAVLRVLSRACATLGCKGRAEELLAELS